MEPLPLFGDGRDEAGIRRISLVRLSTEVARSLSGVGRVAVEGEVVRPQQHPGGVYFTLRDRNAQVSVRCPAVRAGRCRVVAGERVLVTATLGWIPERGQVQLLAEEVAPVGEGAIAAAIAERRARLEAEGLLARPRRALPRLPPPSESCAGRRRRCGPTSSRWWRPGSRATRCGTCRPTCRARGRPTPSSRPSGSWTPGPR
ncbi:MAG TPA: exodeoxyribonuclease VII large subunit [Acidimicrobiales bacterium]|nr:exodeoxyribonuclease VII large subunit [Acidimicrobiales bacterium]